MSATERASASAGDITEGITEIAGVRALRAAPPIAEQTELRAFADTLGRMKAALEAVVAAGQAAGGCTSLRISDALLRNVDAVQAHVATIAPGAPHPEERVDRLDLAWIEVEKAMH
jgi:hypothetical protein